MPSRDGIVEFSYKLCENTKCAKSRISINEYRQQTN